MQFGGTHYSFLPNGSFLVIAQGLVTDDGGGGASAGAVRRWLLSSSFGDFILGAGIHWDMTQSPYDHNYHQVVGNLELLTSNWALRFNGYAPVGETVQTVAASGGGTPLGTVFFQGHNLYTGSSSFQRDEVALGGVEVELAHSVGGLFGTAFRQDITHDAAEVFLGYYNLQGELGPQAHGIKGGLRGYLLPRLAASVTVWEDRVFGMGVYGGITWFFGSGGGNMPLDVEDKLTLPVQRNQQVAFNHVESGTVGSILQLTDNGAPITITHVADGGSGTGTFEDPFGSLTDAAGTTNDIVYVYSGTTFTGQVLHVGPEPAVPGRRRQQPSPCGNRSTRPDHPAQRERRR